LAGGRPAFIGARVTLPSTPVDETLRRIDDIDEDNKLNGHSPRANNTDRETAACRRR
jgi:hypothetical protein